MKTWVTLAFIIAMFFGLHVHEARASDQCTQEFFSSPTESLDSGATDNFISYLKMLLENKTIGNLELEKFISNLRSQILINPIAKEQASVSGRAQVYWNGIEHLINREDLDRDKILMWVGTYLKESKRVRLVRQETQELVRDMHHRIEFLPVPAGQLQEKPSYQRMYLTMDHPIKVMPIPVTQRHWVYEFGVNPSRFAQGENSVIVDVDGRSVEMQADNPVENITWWSAAFLANKLSEKYGLEPVYDFSQVKWNRKTSAAEGTLVPRWAKPHNNKGDRYCAWKDAINVAINPPGCDLYHTEGVRLLTVREQLFLFQGAGVSKGPFYFGDNASDLRYHAWFQENSYNETQPVGLLRPLVINGHEFYDLLGNVNEWNHPGSGDVFRERLLQVTGGSYESESPKRSASTLKCGDFSTYHPTYRRGFIGVRFAMCDSSKVKP